MTTLYLLNCGDATGTFIANQSGLSPDNRLVPHCPNGGSWVQVESQTLTFDLVQWLSTGNNSAEFAAFFGAGFVLVGMSYAVGWGVRSLLSLLGR